ncbi:YlaF family protein [Metaplanococcus flavidus]|uniref:YlaF family protein n=1 Tax=Metaplanococcus flavidus TaxID=569883 RepID=A0ABW3LB23_9BACL
MKNGKWIFALYSIAALLAMVGIGLAVAFRSVPMVLLAIALLGVIMVFGFRKKREMIEAGLL